MTTFEKAMAGDTKAIERYFFTREGATRSDEESDIIHSTKLDYQEKLRRIYALRANQPRAARRRKIVPVHVPFGLLISAADAIRAHALGVQLD